MRKKSKFPEHKFKVSEEYKLSMRLVAITNTLKKIDYYFIRLEIEQPKITKEEFLLNLTKQRKNILKKLRKLNAKKKKTKQKKTKIDFIPFFQRLSENTRTFQ